MPWKPQFEGEFPSLGWYALEWISEYLARPDVSEYEPMVLTPEQANFVLRYYRLDPETGKRVYRRAVWSRPKGHGKSPLVSCIAALESLAEIVPAGWDYEGRPVGKPWSAIRTPWVQLAAVSEDQTKNAYGPLLEMLRQGPVMDEYNVDPMESFVALPKGRIEFVTSSSTSREGNRPVWCGLDQTEEWKPGNGGVRLAAVLRRNLGKTGGTSIETPNAYEPGAKSVAEASADYALQIAEGRMRDEGLLYDHREAPPSTDMSDRDSLLRGLTIAYGDSAIPAGGWVDLDRIVAEIWDPATSAEDAARFYLNQVTNASDSWLSQPVWAACADASKVVADRDTITMGFDGSRGRAKGKPDATALIGCRVNDGHVFTIAVWEAKDDPNTWATWEPPIVEIEAAIADCFRKYRVAAFYADPGKDWRSHVNAWEARWSEKVSIKAGPNHPFEWWMTGGRSGLVERAVEVTEGAIRNKDVTHDGSYRLTRHVLNARRRISHGKLALGKESDYSSAKIDAAVAMVLAYQARLDALSRTVEPVSVSYVPRRLY